MRVQNIHERGEVHGVLKVQLVTKVGYLCARVRESEEGGERRETERRRRGAI